MSEIWPSTLGKNDDLFLAVESDDGTVKYLVLSSAEKKKTLIRDNGAWHQVATDEVLDNLAVYFVDRDAIQYFDELEEKGQQMTLKRLSKYIVDQDIASVTAAVSKKNADACPPATADVSLNLKNRENAIKTAGYGPMNPALPNNKFWAKKAERWSIGLDEARTSTCGNCAAFVITSKMRECIATGISAAAENDQRAWDVIDAGELGYCEAFDFKCAAARTCDAWISGGPVTDSEEQK